MSQAELKRFFQDVTKNASLKSQAEKAGGTAGLAELAKSKGYGVTTDELTALAAQGKDLEEGELAKIAGGWSVCASVGCIGCVSVGS